MTEAQRVKEIPRAKRTLEMRCMGLPYHEIARQMKAEGYRTSYITVRRDLESETAQSFIDELQRRQLADISLSDTTVRLKYRDRLLDKLFPPA